MFFLHRISFLFNYFTERSAAEKRKKGKACRKIEETTTSRSPTENSEVALPKLVKGKQ